MKIAKPYVRTEVRGRAPKVTPVYPVQVVGLHVWNYHVWRDGHAEQDRKCA